MIPDAFQKDTLPYRSLLIHYGEIALKKGNRRHFEELLIQNISALLGETVLFDIRRLPGRISLEWKDGYISKSLLQGLQRVFGIANIAPTVCTASSIEEIERTVDLLVADDHFKSFAIRTKRSEKKFPLSSIEVNRRVGARVESLTGARVDLETPERKINIEILNRQTFVFCHRLPGPGGLPVGSAGKVACLLSGGIDSPVAAWRMMKRGCLPLYIHFSSIPFTDRASIDKVIDMVEHLSYGLPKTIFVVVPFGKVQQTIVTSTPEAFRVLLYRRFMIRIAEAIAREKGASALVTGEALSQVASQTLSNVTAIEAVATMPILRPLIGMDKQEIVDEAKRIGTFKTSCEPHDDCCSFLMPSHPVTHCSPEELQKIESKLDVDGLVKIALNLLQERAFS